MDEALRKQEAERLKLTGEMTEQSAFDPVESQAQDLGNPNIQDPEEGPKEIGCPQLDLYQHEYLLCSLLARRVHIQPRTR